MAVQPFIPPEWPIVYTLTVGQDWPQADEDAVRRCAQAWTDALCGLVNISGAGGQANQNVHYSVQAISSDEFDQYWQQYTTGDDSAVGQLAQQCQMLAEELLQFAEQVEFTKISIDIQLIILLIQVIYDFAISPLTGGLSMGEAFAAMFFTRTVVRDILAKLIEAVIMAVLPDLITQEVMLADGHRSHLDVGELAQSAQMGLIGGLVGMGAGKMLGGLGKGLENSLGKRLGGLVSAGVTGAITNVGTNLAVSAVNSIENPNADQKSGGDLLSTVVNGAFTGMLFHGVHEMRQKPAVTFHTSDGTLKGVQTGDNSYTLFPEDGKNAGKLHLATLNDDGTLRLSQPPLGGTTEVTPTAVQVTHDNTTTHYSFGTDGQPTATHVEQVVTGGGQHNFTNDGQPWTPPKDSTVTYVPDKGPTQVVLPADGTKQAVYAGNGDGSFTLVGHQQQTKDGGYTYYGADPNQQVSSTAFHQAVNDAQQPLPAHSPALPDQPAVAAPVTAQAPGTSPVSPGGTLADALRSPAPAAAPTDVPTQPVAPSPDAPAVAAPAPAVPAPPVEPRMSASGDTTVKREPAAPGPTGDTTVKRSTTGRRPSSTMDRTAPTDPYKTQPDVYATRLDGETTEVAAFSPKDGRPLKTGLADDGPTRVMGEARGDVPSPLELAEGQENVPTAPMDPVAEVRRRAALADEATELFDGQTGQPLGPEGERILRERAAAAVTEADPTAHRLPGPESGEPGVHEAATVPDEPFDPYTGQRRGPGGDEPTAPGEERIPTAPMRDRAELADMHGAATELDLTPLGDRPPAQEQGGPYWSRPEETPPWQADPTPDQIAAEQQRLNREEQKFLESIDPARRRLYERIRAEMTQRDARVRQDLRDAMGDGGLVGTEHFRKRSASIDDKIGKLSPERRAAVLAMADDPARLLATFSGDLNDLQRYTVTYDKTGYVEATLDQLRTLQDKGYRLFDGPGRPVRPILDGDRLSQGKYAKNFWREGNRYDGLNVTLVGPTGEVFELQFHTPESYRLKQNLTEVMYKVASGRDSDPLRKVNALQELVAVNRKYLEPLPTGIERLGPAKDATFDTLVNEVRDRATPEQQRAVNQLLLDAGEHVPAHLQEVPELSTEDRRVFDVVPEGGGEPVRIVVDRTESRWVLHTDDAKGRELLARAGAMDPEAEILNVIGHATRDGFLIDGRVVPFHEVFERIAVPEDADLVRLIGCDAGDGEAVRALATELGRPVIASDKTVWMTKDGKLISSSPVDPQHDPYPKRPPDGKWKMFLPDGGERTLEPGDPQRPEAPAGWEPESRLADVAAKDIVSILNPTSRPPEDLLALGYGKRQRLGKQEAEGLNRYGKELEALLDKVGQGAQAGAVGGATTHVVQAPEAGTAYAIAGKHLSAAEEGQLQAWQARLRNVRASEQILRLKESYAQEFANSSPGERARKPVWAHLLIDVPGGGRRGALYLDEVRDALFERTPALPRGQYLRQDGQVILTAPSGEPWTYARFPEQIDAHGRLIGEYDVGALRRLRISRPYEEQAVAENAARRERIAQLPATDLDALVAAYRRGSKALRQELAWRAVPPELSQHILKLEREPPSPQKVLEWLSQGANHQRVRPEDLKVLRDRADNPEQFHAALAEKMKPILEDADIRAIQTAADPAAVLRGLRARRVLSQSDFDRLSLAGPRLATDIADLAKPPIDPELIGYHRRTEALGRFLDEFRTRARSDSMDAVSWALNDDLPTSTDGVHRKLVADVLARRLQEPLRRDPELSRVVEALAGNLNRQAPQELPPPAGLDALSGDDRAAAEHEWNRLVEKFDLEKSWPEIRAQIEAARGGNLPGQRRELAERILRTTLDRAGASAELPKEKFQKMVTVLADAARNQPPDEPLRQPPEMSRGQWKWFRSTFHADEAWRALGREIPLAETLSEPGTRLHSGDREHDAEEKIYAILDEVFTTNPPPAGTTLVVTADLPMCPACQEVSRQFAQRHGVRIVVLDPPSSGAKSTA